MYTDALWRISVLLIHVSSLRNDFLISIMTVDISTLRLYWIVSKVFANCDLTITESSLTLRSGGPKRDTIKYFFVDFLWSERRSRDSRVQKRTFRADVFLLNFLLVIIMSRLHYVLSRSVRLGIRPTVHRDLHVMETDNVRELRFRGDPWLSLSC